MALETFMITWFASVRWMSKRILFMEILSFLWKAPKIIPFEKRSFGWLFVRSLLHRWIWFHCRWNRCHYVFKRCKSLVFFRNNFLCMSLISEHSIVWLVTYEFLNSSIFNWNWNSIRQSDHKKCYWELITIFFSFEKNLTKKLWSDPFGCEVFEIVVAIK